MTAHQRNTIGLAPAVEHPAEAPRAHGAKAPGAAPSPEARGGGAPIKSKRPPLTRAQKEAIAEMRGVRGKTYGQIAIKIDASYGAVSWYCLIQGIDPPNPKPLPAKFSGPLVVTRNGKPVRRYTPEDDARLLELEASGVNYSAIGRKIGRRPNSIRGRLATLARREERAACA